MFHPVISDLITPSQVNFEFSEVLHFSNAGHETLEMFLGKVMVFVEAEF